jgi:Secretion system C-terminal sorting domain
MKKSILVIALLLVGVLLQRAFAQTYIAHPSFREGKIRFYAQQAGVINPATVAYTVDLAPAMFREWSEAPTASNGPNAVIVYNNKLFVSFDIGFQRGGVLVYDMLNMNLWPIAIKPGGGVGNPSAGIAIQPATGNVYIASYHGGVNGGEGGIYYSTAANNYATVTKFAGYTSSNSVDYYSANLAFDSANNLWATTWNSSATASQMFLICYKNTIATNYYKIVNTAAKSYTATSTGGVSKTVHLLSAPEGMVRDASGNLWLGNNNDFNAVNNAGEGTLVKISNAWITSLLTQAVGSTVTVPAASVNAYYIPSGKLGGMALLGNTLYINDQGQMQGPDYLINGTVWKYDVTTAFNATNFKASGIRATYPGNGQMGFSTILPTQPPPITKVYVKADANGANSGESFANAFTRFQDALYSGYDSIFVAAGTYYPTEYPTECTNCIGSRTFTFELSSNAKIFGGFVGTEKWLSQRPAVSPQPSILSGDIGVVGTSSDNALHVVLLHDIVSVEIDRFTIRDGWADNPAELTLANNPYPICNTSGAGVFANNSSFTMRNCIIRNNTIQAVGGTSQYHSTESGAGIYVNNHTTLDLINNEFINNWATKDGGGLYIDAYASNYTNVTNCTFTGNISNRYGGGCNLANAYGGGFNTCVFNTNVAQYGGGLAAVASGDIDIKNSVFNNNSIISSFAGKGAGLYIDYLYGYSLINSTFYNNKATNAGALGGGLYEGEISYTPGTRNSDIKNCIFYGNSANGVSSDMYSINTTVGGIAQVGNCMLGNTASLTNMVDLQTNKFGMSPLFIDAANPIGADNKWRTADDGLQLTCAVSPAINAASTAFAPTTDIRGSARQGIPDMGAYEATCANTAIFQSNSTTCQSIVVNAVTGNQWFNFANASGIICSINPQGQNLGNVTAKVADPTGIVVNGVTRYMGRSVNLTSTIPPNTNYLLRIYFKDTEITEFQSATGQTGLTPGSFKIMWASGGTNTSCGVNNFYGTTGGVIGNTGVTTGEFGSNNEGFYLQIGLDHFTLFAATTDTQNTIVGTENEEIASANANIYPNPTTNDLNIELTGNTDVKMDAQIFDITGRVMTAKQNIQDGKANIKMQDMPNGIYNLVITNGTQVVLSKRVVKM